MGFFLHVFLGLRPLTPELGLSLIYAKCFSCPLGTNDGRDGADDGAVGAAVCTKGLSTPEWDELLFRD